MTDKEHSNLDEKEPSPENSISDNLHELEHEILSTKNEKAEDETVDNSELENLQLEEKNIISESRDALSSLRKEILESIEKKKHENIDEKKSSITQGKNEYNPTLHEETNTREYIATIGRQDSRKKTEKFAASIIEKTEKRFGIKIPTFIKNTLTS